MRKILIFGLLLLFIQPAFTETFVSDKDFNNAIKSGNIEFVKENISKVENIDSDECFLCTAIDKKQNDILDILLKKCDPNCPDSLLLPLYGALVSNNNYAVDKLLEAGADPNIDRHLAPLLVYAIVDGNAHAVTKLLEAGANENMKFLKFSAVQLAFTFNSNLYDIEDAFINFWNKRFKNPPTDINKALELLKNSKEGNKYYLTLIGENSANNPFRIVFCDLDKIDTNAAKFDFLNIYNSSMKQSTIYINNNFRNVEPEIIATMLAGASINTDGKSSVVEQLVAYGVMANVWNEFSNSKINDISNPLVKGYNGMLNIINLETGSFNKGDYNNLWALSGLLRGMKQTSKGFRNKNLNVYFE